MNIRVIDFKTWCRNHSDAHEAKWCRELYPWPVFSTLDYSDVMLNRDQVITFNGSRYRARILLKVPQIEARYRFDIHLESTIEEPEVAPSRRTWNSVFSLVCSREGEFITLFTRGEDPSMQLLADFMSGRFDHLRDIGTLSLRALLAKTLISYTIADAYGGMDHYSWFSVNERGYRHIPDFRVRARDSSVHPMFSRGRDLWISYAFYEGSAQVWAGNHADQCQRLISLYCNPAVGPHYRCKYEGVEVISLFQLLARSPLSVRSKFEPHVRFLQSHPADSFENKLEKSSVLHNLILSGAGEPAPVKISEVNEALAQLDTPVEDVYDFIYLMAAANALNAWVNAAVKEKRGYVRKEAYAFKQTAARSIEAGISHKFKEAEIHVAADNIIYVRFFGVQFSFRSVPQTPAIRAFKSSPENKAQVWSGIRLQPIAGWVLDWARALRAEQHTN